VRILTTIKITSGLTNGSTPLFVNGAGRDLPHDKEVEVEEHELEALCNSTTFFTIVGRREASDEPAPAKADGVATAGGGEGDRPLPAAGEGEELAPVEETPPEPEALVLTEADEAPAETVTEPVELLGDEHPDETSILKDQAAIDGAEQHG
jgi:hypothetical protein